MKTIFVIMFLLMVGTWAAHAHPARELCGIRFDSVGQGGGSRLWTESQTSPCLMDGGSCKITPIWCDLIGGVEQAPGGGYSLHGKVTGLGYSTVGVTPSVTGTISNDGFTFKNKDAWVTITSCSAYPGLIGASVNMAGVTTDAHGEFSVFIPVYN